MQFRIASTFTASLARLSATEQTAVKTTVFDLQTDLIRPGLRIHSVEGARDRNFRAARVNRDIRIIVHQSGDNMTLCYVNHHDDAYTWACGRKMEVHPRTGAMQIVEIQETVREIEVPIYVAVERPTPPKPPPAADIPDDALLSYGIPTEWLDSVRSADEDGLLDIASHLPEEAGEALLQIAVGAAPQPTLPMPAGSDPFEHPDAMRRFRVMRDVEELAQALDYPWDRWSVFLHPAQLAIVERDYSGSARVSGSAGTGKTIVALHRAVYLARKNPDARVLLTTFSETLASVLRDRLRILISSEPRLGERIEVYAIDALAERLYTLNIGTPSIASEKQIRMMILEASASAENNRFSPNFVLAEWRQVVDAWQLYSWEAYRDIRRMGRRRRLSEGHRQVLWAIFEKLRKELRHRGLITRADMFGELASRFCDTQRSPFDFVIVDEAQDIDVPQLRFMAVLGQERPDGLFFAGDLGQRIFQHPFSWRALGIDIRGRSHTLKINYRTSHQIRRRSDLLLGIEIADADGNTEERSGTISVFNGPEPILYTAKSEDDEAKAVAAWLKRLVANGLKPHEMSVFVRSAGEIGRVTAAIERAGLKYIVLDDDVRTIEGHVSTGTMHMAKGLEFRAVVVMACDDEIIPLQTRIESVTDESDLEDIYNTERHLLYVACTRARDNLLVAGVEPASEFLDDLRVGSEEPRR